MVKLGKSEVDATEINTTSTSNARLASTSSIDDDNEISSVTQDHPYVNTHIKNNHNLENQTREHDDLYENVTNVSGGDAGVTQETANDEINTSGCHLTFVNSKNITVNLATQ